MRSSTLNIDEENHLRVVFLLGAKDDPDKNIFGLKLFLSFHCMEQDDHLAELSKRISELAAEMEKSRQELTRLQREVDQFSEKASGKISTIHHQPKAEYKQPVRFSFENFVGLRLIHFIGIIALVMGLAIGVKYAIDKNMISPLVRIMLAYLAAIILFFISYRLRKNYRLFSLILFGGSVATAYFTTYGAYAYYEFLPLIVAFVMMVMLTIFTVFYSIKYNSQELAVLALVGGYGIPFLVRTNAENWIGLFSYIFFMDVAIVVLSFKRYWTILSFLSFTATWIIFLSAVYLKYQRIGFIMGFSFSIVFFLLFIVNTIAFKIVRRQQLSLPDSMLILIDITLLYFAFLRLLRFDTFQEVSIMTLIFGVVPLLGGYLLKNLGQPFLQRGLTSFGLLMTIIFVPMRFEQLTITIIWVLMAAVFFVIGLWQKYKLFRLVSIGLFGVTLFKLIAIDSLRFTAIQKVISYILLGSILLAVSFLYQKFRSAIFEEDKDQ
jgi:uncharacterized membrane protein